MTDTATNCDTIEQPKTAQAYCAKLAALPGFGYRAEFVPFSQSRNAGEKSPSLNWRITIKRNRAELVTDYMQGAAHIPHYSHRLAAIAVYSDAVKEACETGKSRLVAGKNAFDACKADMAIRTAKPLPPPSLDAVLYSLLSDAGAIDYTFEQWAAEFGYDEDSRSAEQIYRQCLDIGIRLKQILPDIEAAREAFQDY